MQDTEMNTKVLIAGGVPVGLMTALGLNKQGVDAILVEKNPTTTKHPKLDVTNKRSMELFRRWGVAENLRAVTVPVDHWFDAIWVSNVAGHEFARVTYPTPNDYRSQALAANDGTKTLEPPMRASQILIEPCLKEHLEAECSQIDVRYGWELDSRYSDLVIWMSQHSKVLRRVVICLLRWSTSEMTMSRAYMKLDWCLCGPINMSLGEEIRCLKM